MSPGNSEADYTQAKMECNISKNRYPNILPSMSVPDLANDDTRALHDCMTSSLNHCR